jgi:hypothetical protein
VLRSSKTLDVLDISNMTDLKNYLLFLEKRILDLEERLHSLDRGEDSRNAPLANCVEAI